ncbi:Hypothetical protein PBC10988_14310 [Planctomycetales bacterium 10988]|nr:Hypothetical protein PBC10988_14310 [Planctomycetales bacterium 10988]
MDRPAISEVGIALKQIQFAREYTLTLLEDMEDELWYQFVGEDKTHLAWQVGHIAMSQYMLTLFRVRGKKDEDEAIIPRKHLKAFAKGSIPQPFEESPFTPEELRHTFNGVYQQVMREIPEYTDEDLSQSVVLPYMVHANQLGSLYFASAHEMLHAGQIGLIRRLLGKEKVR